MTQIAILKRLEQGPATNRQLQDAACDHGGGVARTCARLIKSGRVVRVDGERGRGRAATYALKDSENE